ncbi:hypothetical protein HYC85_010510 [Camellia sinensis]|uniref:Zinc finger PHD-type domain-containing protein n=1 Tax=Camellia sinensis TaxID=4442 RepID=A0A7J7HKU3_CAMSI|nr:hypothetical protein HYC85_010510 [Camellia sinensis]
MRRRRLKHLFEQSLARSNSLAQIKISNLVRRICFCSLGFPRELHSDEAKNEFLEEVSRVEDFLKDPWLLTVRAKATVQVAVPKVVAPPPPPVAVGLGDGDGEEMLSAQRKRAAMQRKAAAASLVAEDYARRMPLKIFLEKIKISLMSKLCAGYAILVKMKEIYFIGVHGPVLHAEFVRSAEGLETKLGSCSVKGVMVHTIVTASNLRTRDSESTPMVCCDVCQRWVHCQCDGISDEKYLQFQVDGNLQYKCATCRGECYQVSNLEEAVQELWRRRDETDRDLIASLRATAGLPTQEEIFSISPYSDDEESGPIMLKNEYGRSLKFSLKGIVDKSPKKTKEYGKKSSNKKYAKKKGYHSSLISKSEAHNNFEGHRDPPSFGYSGIDDKNDDMQSHRSEPFSSPVAGSLSEGICSINQAAVLKHSFIDEVTVGNANTKSRMVQINSKPQGFGIGGDAGKDASKSKATNTKGPKLVIHLGARNRNLTSSPRSDASSYQKEQELTTSNGSEDVGQEQIDNRQMLDGRAKFDGPKGDKEVHSDQLKGPKSRGKEGNLIKIRKVNSEFADIKPKFGGGNMADEHESVSLVNPLVSLGKRSIEESKAVSETAADVPAIRSDKVSLRKNMEGRPDDSTHTPSGSQFLPRDSKPLLKLKFKNPYHENQSSWAPHVEDEKSSVKGQRSKRKRPLPFMEKTSTKEDGDASLWDEDNSMNEIMDANWILRKLGKDAIGKRVEVHQPSDNTWHKGMVKDVTEDTSIVSVALDDGRAKNLELEKHGIRFVSQKQKRKYYLETIIFMGSCKSRNRQKYPAINLMVKDTDFLDLGHCCVFIFLKMWFAGAVHVNQHDFLKNCLT